MASSRDFPGSYNDNYAGRPQASPSTTVPPQSGVYPVDPYYGNYPRNTPQVMPANYKFTPEETRVMKECNRESFYQRCLPLMSTLGLGTYYAMKTGYIASGSSAIVGPVGKVGIAVMAGFVLGKLSYFGQCEAKILTLPDSSQLKQALLRKKVSGGSGVADTLRDSLVVDSTFGQSVIPYGGADAYNYEPRSSMDLDTNRPIENFDDSFQLKTDGQEEEISLIPIEPSRSVTYDELRRKNREGYDYPRQNYGPSGYIDNRTPYQERSFQHPISPLDTVDQRYPQAPPTYSPHPTTPPPYQNSSPKDQPVSGQPARKNQYGDLWDK